MRAIEWNDRFALKIKKLDDQHKKMFHLLRRLGETMDNEEGEERRRAVYDDLIDFTETHFESEEEMMEQFRYSDYQLHTDEHNFLLDVAKNLKEKLDLKGQPMRKGDMTLLLDWLELHILGADKKLGEFLTGRGVK